MVSILGMEGELGGFMFSWESGEKASGLHASPPYCKPELLPISFHLFRKMIYPASPLWYKLPLLIHSVGAQRGGEGSSQNILGAFHQSPPFTHTLVWCVLVNSGGLMRKPHATLVTNVQFDSCSWSAISTGLQNSDFTDGIPSPCHLYKFIIIWSAALFSIQSVVILSIPVTLNLISTSFQKTGVINVVGCHLEF